MTSLPVEVLLGIYLGLLTGIVPAFVAGALGFIVRYFTGVTLPGLGVVVLALSIASVQGGLLGLVEPDIAQSPRLLVAVLVVLMLALYAHSQGDKLGTQLPRRVSFSELRRRTLSADVVEMVGGIGQVRVRPAGEIRDIEGYPPLPAALRDSIRDGSWRLPADLPLAELEFRLEERLRTQYDLADVSASIDERGRATISAAPPSGSLTRRVPDGSRAVSIDVLAPTGLARGDSVTVYAGETAVQGTVLSVKADGDPDDTGGEKPAAGEDDEAENGATTPTTRTGTVGGPGRITVAVPRRTVRTLLEASAPKLVVQPAGTDPAYEALSLVKRVGYGMKQLTVRDGVDSVDRLDRDDVTILAVRRRGSEREERRHGWVFAPGVDRRLGPGDEAFVVGPTDALERFTKEVAR